MSKKSPGPWQPGDSITVNLNEDRADDPDQPDGWLSANPFRLDSESELVTKAWGEPEKYGPAMQVEMGRRLMKTMRALEKTNSRLTWVGIVLAVVGVVLGGLQVWAAFRPQPAATALHQP